MLNAIPYIVPGNSSRAATSFTVLYRQNIEIQNINRNPVKMKVDNALIVPLRGTHIYYLSSTYRLKLT